MICNHPFYIDWRMAAPCVFLNGVVFFNGFTFNRSLDNAAASRSADILGVEPPDMSMPPSFGVTAKFFNCPESACGKGFRSSSQLNQHSRVHRPNEFPCPNDPPCGKCLVTKQSADEHKVAKHDKPNLMTCKHPGCGKVFKGKDSANKHYLFRHTEQGQKYKCKTCGKGFGAPSHLKNHEKTHNSTKTISRKRRKVNPTS